MRAQIVMRDIGGVEVGRSWTLPPVEKKGNKR